jgi:hypothetical protein
LRGDAAEFSVNLSPGRRISLRPAGTGGLNGCCAASEEMDQEQDQTDNQDNVNKTRSYVKCEKPKQPEND